MFQILKMTINPSRIVSLCNSSKPYTSFLNIPSENQGPWTEFGRSFNPLPKHWFLFFFFNQFYILYSIGFQLGMILPPGDIWQCLEIFLAVTTGMRVGLLLASRVYRSVMLLNVL